MVDGYTILLYTIIVFCRGRYEFLWT